MGFRQISSYLPEQVPANKFLFARIVPANKFLFAGTVPANNLFHFKMKSIKDVIIFFWPG